MALPPGYILLSYTFYWQNTKLDDAHTEDHAVWEALIPAVRLSWENHQQQDAAIPAHPPKVPNIWRPFGQTTQPNLQLHKRCLSKLPVITCYRGSKFILYELSRHLTSTISRATVTAAEKGRKRKRLGAARWPSLVGCSSLTLAAISRMLIQAQIWYNTAAHLEARGVMRRGITQSPCYFHHAQVHWWRVHRELGSMEQIFVWTLEHFSSLKRNLKGH